MRGERPRGRRRHRDAIGQGPGARREAAAVDARLALSMVTTPWSGSAAPPGSCSMMGAERSSCALETARSSCALETAPWSNFRSRPLSLLPPLSTLAPQASTSLRAMCAMCAMWKTTWLVMPALDGEWTPQVAFAQCKHLAYPQGYFENIGEFRIPGGIGAGRRDRSIPGHAPSVARDGARSTRSLRLAGRGRPRRAKRRRRRAGAPRSSAAATA